MEFSTLPEFDAELAKLLKKYRSLEEDIEVLKSVLVKYLRGYQPVIFQITNLGIKTEIYKVKHFRCKALHNKGSRSGIRIIYAYLEVGQKIEFTEIYYKEHDDAGCDKDRIRSHYQ
jgi:hypothetical protein